MPVVSQNIKRSEDSDEEDDDYVPAVADEDSDSENSGEDENKEGLNAATAVVDLDEQKRAREALWSNFQASVANPSQRPQGHAATPRVVKIEKRYRFAGEDVVDIVEVAEDSAEAKKWPLWKDPSLEGDSHPNKIANSALPLVEAGSQASGNSTPLVTMEGAPADISMNVEQTLSSGGIAPSTKAAKPPVKRPGPRKPKTTLASLPGSSKPKKLTTLDKSAMDWRSHLQAEQASGSSVKDELEANRRGGGYLEKVEFLKRVEERKEENLDALKSNKRRKL